MPSSGILILIPVVVLALVFDFVNGFHDTANAIATSVSTKALSPRWAIFIAAAGDLIGALVLGTSVAKTVGKGIVDPAVATPLVLSAALFAAIAWNLITWYFGIPSSSSHALIGGLMGAAIGALGLSSIHWAGFTTILLGLIISPILGLAIGSLIMTSLFWLVRTKSPSKINNNFRIAQMFSACAIALSHGMNDAQKSMGVITMVLFGAGAISTFTVPTWV
ncbi:MAG: anion permease, partial [Candidatus Saccharibacteria bacterium]